MWCNVGCHLYSYISLAAIVERWTALPLCRFAIATYLLHGLVAAGQLQMGIQGIQGGELFLEVDDARGHVGHRLGRRSVG